MVRTVSQRRSFSGANQANNNNNNNNTSGVSGNSGSDVLQIDNVSISRKTKFRYILARCDNYEKQLADLLQSLSLYTRRTAKLRDSGDCISDAFAALASGEAVNPTFKRATVELSKTVRSIQDHRDSEVLYFEEKLLTSLSQYGEGLQKQKERIRSAVPKVVDADKSRNSMWISGNSASQASISGSSRRRSQSADRAERVSKEERELQRQVQQYEFQKNLVLKKLMLRFLLTELRLTIKSFNSLTTTYRNVLRDFSPQHDLKNFNEFFGFRPIKKSILNEIQDDVSDFDSANDDDDDEDDGQDADEQAESGLEENVNSIEDNTEAPDDDEEENSESLRSESLTNSLQGPTLRRFNSTPEMDLGKSPGKKRGELTVLQSTNKGGSNNASILRSVNERMISRSQSNNNNSSFNTKRTSQKMRDYSNTQGNIDDEDDEEDEDDDEEDDNGRNNRRGKKDDDDSEDEDGDKGSRSSKRRPGSSRQTMIRSVRKQQQYK